jgi:surface protein
MTVFETTFTTNAIGTDITEVTEQTQKNTADIADIKTDIEKNTADIAEMQADIEKKLSQKIDRNPEGRIVLSDGIELWVETTADGNAKIKILKDGVFFSVNAPAIATIPLTLVCKNVADDSVLTTIQYNILEGETLYFNNDTAPTLDGFDFVLLEGIRHDDFSEINTLNVYYVDSNVSDRGKTDWSDAYYNYEGDAVLPLNTLSATTMGNMFGHASKITTAPKMNTSNVTNMWRMFYLCGALTTVPPMDTSKVTDMSEMFASCGALTTVPKMDTSQVTNMEMMFYYCSSLTTVPPMDTSKVTNMREMFAGCSNLKIDWEIDMSSCTNCKNMFQYSGVNNVKLKNVPKDLWLLDLGRTYTVINYI